MMTHQGTTALSSPCAATSLANGIGRTLSFLALALMVSVGAMSLDAEAGVRKKCRSGVCGKSTWDGTRVSIYLTHQLTGISHYNFKTNPGAQIEIGGYYSFNAARGRSGTYSAQACRRGGALQSSLCSGWATFRWNTTKRTR
jgi:hypothetical protein